MGHHNHDNEECPEVPVVVAWLDACTTWVCVLVYSPVAGKTKNVFLCLVLTGISITIHSFVLFLIKGNVNYFHNVLNSNTQHLLVRSSHV